MSDPELQTAPPTVSALARYRSTSPPAMWAICAFVALVVADALVTFSMLGQLRLLQAVRSGLTITGPQAAHNDALQYWFATLQLVLSFLALISLSVWVYRASRNAHALGVKCMKYTPAWSVGWFFVPLANLFVPYQVLKELWTASTPGIDTVWQSKPVPPILRAWAVIWFATGFIGYTTGAIVAGHLRLADIATFGPYWVDHLWEYSWGLLIAEVVRIAASVLTIIVIIRITNLQQPIQWRFSLRGLLIATTLVAAVLGLVAWAVR